MTDAVLRANERFYDAFARGDLRGRVEVKSSDEIGQMAASFGAFLTSLRENIRTIKHEGEELNCQSDELARVVRALV